MQKPSDNLLFHLEHDRPANEIEYREYRNGRPYIDCDGEWRIGRDYKLREDSPKSPEPEGPPMLGGALIVCAGMVVTYALAWIVWAFWPIIRAMMGW